MNFPNFEWLGLFIFWKPHGVWLDFAHRWARCHNGFCIKIVILMSEYYSAKSF